MSDLIKFNFSEFSFISIILLGLVIALVFKLVKNTISTKISNRWIKNQFPFIEIVFWFLFILWSINFVFKDSFYHTIAVLTFAAIIIVWFSWFLARDIIAGFILRLSDNFYKGQSFKMDNLQGIIKHVGFLYLGILNSDGNIAKIPWSKINGQIYLKGNREELTNKYEFKVRRSKNLTLEKTQSKIRETILLAVGSSHKKEPEIKLINSSDKEWEFRVTVFALTPEYFRSIERNVINTEIN